MSGQSEASFSRILLILTEFPPGFGGMQTHASYLARQLAARGHDILVLTHRPADPETAAACAAHDAACGYRVLRVLSRVAHWHSVAVARQWLRQFAPQLVYASNVYYGHVVGGPDAPPLIARCVGNDVLRPWIAYPFQLGSSLLARPWVEQHLLKQFRRWNMPEWVERLLRGARQRLMRQSAQRHDRLLANSAFTAGALSHAGVAAERVQVLVGGVDAARFAPRQRPHGVAALAQLRASLGLPAQGRLLLTACRLVPKKGLDFLLRQMPALLARHADVHLVVLGEGREQRRCLALADSLGPAARARVHFVGRVAHERIHLYYWCAHAFVLASRVVHSRVGGFMDAETMGRVLCEAQAAGLPLLASRSGGIPSVVRHGDNGLLFAEDDGGDFLQQLARLLDEPALRRRLMREGLRTAARELDWAHIVAAHERVFAQALARDAQGGALQNPASSDMPSPVAGLA